MTEKGKIIAIIAWIVFAIFTATQMACLDNNSCNVIDIMVYGVIVIGMAVPAWVAGTLFGGSKDN